MNDYPHSYPPEQHRAALGDMLRDMQTVIVTPCPECGEPMDYEPAGWEGDPEVIDGMRKYPGGWCCPECGKFVADEQGETDAD